MANNSINSTTQQYLDIYDISNDIVVMKDGATSIILAVSALNFGLLAEAEQDAIIYSYAALLNSINYPIEILVKSQTKDVTNYLHLLKDQEDKAESRNKALRIGRYREFVANLIQERNVLDKKFYVVITASPIEMGVLTAQSVVPGVSSPDVSTLEKSLIIERARTNLEPKRDHLVAQFGRIGLYSRQLKTQEIIQLFYVSYNPEAAEGQHLTDSKNYTTPLVKASVQGNIMTDQTQTPTPMGTPAQAPAPTPPQPSQPVVPPAPVAAATPTMPTPAATTPTEPVAPAMPSPDEVVAAATSPVQDTPTAPAMPDAPSPAVNPAASADIQSEIDSTIQQLGSQPAGKPVAGTPVPPATQVEAQNASTTTPTPVTPPAAPSSEAVPTPNQPAELPEI